MSAEEFVQSAGLANGAGPDFQTISVKLSDVPGPKYIEAWISNFGGSNVHLLHGVNDLAGAQNRLERGFDDILMTLTGTGPVKRRLPDHVNVIGILFEGANNSGQFQVVTLRVVRLT